MQQGWGWLGSGARLRRIRRFQRSGSCARHCADDQERFDAARNGRGQGRVRGRMREIGATREEANVRPAQLRFAVADRPAQDGDCVSIASRTERSVAGPSTSRCMSTFTRSSARRCAGSSTQITRASALRRTKRPEIPYDRRPGVARIGRHIDLAAGGAEIHAARFKRIDRHRIAQDVDVAVALR